MSTGKLPPVSNNWTGPYISRALLTNIRPNDPPSTNNEAYMLFNIDWTAFVPQAIEPCYLFKTGQSTDPLKQIAALYIDNTLCNQDLYIQFVDNQFTLRIPGGAAPAVYPVITNGTDFFAWLDNSKANDAYPTADMLTPFGNTKLYVLNANIPPILPQETQREELLTVHGSSTGTFLPYDGRTLAPFSSILVTAVDLHVTNFISGAGGSNVRWSLIFNKNSITGSQVNYFVGTIAPFGSVAYDQSLVRDERVNMLVNYIELDINLVAGVAPVNCDTFLRVRYKNVQGN